MYNTFENFLIEETQKYKRPPKLLYHLVDYDSMQYIIDNGFIKGKNYHMISTTKDPKINFYVGATPILFRIVLDGIRLNNDYELSTYTFKSYNGEKFKDEKEIQIKPNLDGKIDNIGKYIIRIEIIKSRLENMLRRLYDDSEFVHKINTIIKNTKQFAHTIEVDS